MNMEKLLVRDQCHVDCTATCTMYIGHARVDDTAQETGIDAKKRISREMESRSEGGELRDDQEEVLYHALLRGKREEGLEQQIRTLFASCSSVTAQENLLVSLRCSPSIYSTLHYAVYTSCKCLVMQASVTGGGCKKARLCQGIYTCSCKFTIYM